jgi:hypothetical protein
MIVRQETEIICMRWKKENNPIDPARMHCEIVAEEQPQVLRLRYAPLRMTDFLYRNPFKPDQ